MAKIEVTVDGETKTTEAPVEMKFQDSRGDEYLLVVGDHDESIDIVLTYPDGDNIALESIVQS